MRSAKSLDLAREFNRYQRSWFAQLRARAAAGDPIAVVNADAPQEIFRALDIPYVVTQWWSSVVAAKQKATSTSGTSRPSATPTPATATPHWLLEAHSTTIATVLRGGAPRPAILHAVAGGDSMAKLFEAGRSTPARTFT